MEKGGHVSFPAGEDLHLPGVSRPARNAAGEGGEDIDAQVIAWLRAGKESATG
jgi:hypothetical protein